MRARTLPAAAGWSWLAGGFLIFRRNPPALGMLVAAYWITLLFLNLIPVLGALAASLLVPGLSVGLMQACRDLDRGQPVGLQTLFGSLRKNPRVLVALGALYLLSTLGALGVSTLADGGDLLRMMLARDAADELPEAGSLLLSAGLVTLLMVPVLMAYWYAPVLAAWHGLSASKALFFSFVACWMNRGAFLAYGLAMLLFAAVLPGLLVGLLLALFPGAQSFVSALVTMPMALIVAPTLFASFYVSYRDVFALAESA